MPTKAGTRGGPFRSVAGGLRVALSVRPGARRRGIEGPVERDDGSVVLKLSVTEAPEGGRANDAVIRLLAESWGLPKTALSVVAGRAGRRKTVLVEGDPAELGPRLEAWLVGLERRELRSVPQR